MISVVLSCLDLAWSNTISWRGWKNNFSCRLVAIKKIFCTAELKFNKTLSYYYSEKIWSWETRENGNSAVDWRSSRPHRLTCGAETLLGPVVYSQVPSHRDAVVLQGQVGRLVSLVVGPAQRYRRQQVEANLAVGFGVFDGRAVFGRFQLVCVKAWGENSAQLVTKGSFSPGRDKATCDCTDRAATGNELKKKKKGGPNCWAENHFFIHWEQNGRKKVLYIHSKCVHLI